MNDSVLNWKWWLFCSWSSGWSPRALFHRLAQCRLASRASIAQRSCARTKNTCSRQRIAKVAGPRGALLSAFRLPISRGECTRRAAAPAPLTHRTLHTRHPHTARLLLHGSTLGRPFDFTFPVHLPRKNITSPITSRPPRMCYEEPLCPSSNDFIFLHGSKWY